MRGLDLVKTFSSASCASGDAELPLSVEWTVHESCWVLAPRIERTAFGRPVSLAWMDQASSALEKRSVWWGVNPNAN
jgi:hypothetical protein